MTFWPPSLILQQKKHKSELQVDTLSFQKVTYFSVKTMVIFLTSTSKTMLFFHQKNPQNIIPSC